MTFSEPEIELALRLKDRNVPWEPAVGHYVYDAGGIVDRPSPFQAHVYFVLNYDYFMGLVGGLERFRREMTWLPTWEDARDLLGRLRISDADVQAALSQTKAIEQRCERLALYRLICERLPRHAD